MARHVRHRLVVGADDARDVHDDRHDGPADGRSTTRAGSAGSPRALPPEARETLELIASGGPFPFDRDGTVFMNREGSCPTSSRGYYREYTVVTPGSDDRGARRIVAGAGSERYYTDDHYESFRRIGR